MLKYFLSQLTQMCTWFGILVIVFALFASRGQIVLLGTVMIFLHDDIIKDFIAKRAPGLTKWIQEVMDDLV